MRIAMIIEAWKPIWGGGQAHVFELSKKLVANHNCKVDIYIMNLRDEKNNTQQQIEEFKNGNLRIIRTGKPKNFYSFKDRIFWIFDVIKEVKKSHRKSNYALIHAHANLPGIPGKILSKILKIPIVYTIHGSGVEVMKDMYGKTLRSLIFYNLENFLHTKIKYSHQISVDRKILDKKNINTCISIIPNGVDIIKFKNTKIIKPPYFKIIFVGRLTAQKGLLSLISALSLIKDQFPKNCELHIIGKGELHKTLLNEINHYNLNNIVRLRGAIFDNNLVKEYLSSNLFILPSIYEGQPLTLLEAWAAKLPVIVTDVGDNKYFVKNGINGYLVSPKNSKVLAEKIMEAINNPQLKKMGLKGYALVKEKYTWNNVAKKTYAIYQTIS